MKHIFLFFFLITLSLTGQAKVLHTDRGDWELVWQDNFRGNKLSYVWSRIPRMSSVDWNNYMSTDDRLFKVRGGKLILYGRVNDFLPQDTARYLTGGVWTKGRKLFYRGRIDIRIKMDNATGAWPAAWLRQPRSGFDGPIKKDKYNIYSVELYEDSLCFLINGKVTGTYRRQPELGPKQYPFDRPMYLLIDMQLGGSWVGPVKGEELPYEYKIDYVKFYRKK